MTETTVSNTAPTEAAPTETPPATEPPPAPARPCLVPTSIMLLASDDNTLVLRAKADSGFYNIDRDANTSGARNRMRRLGRELAKRHGVVFTDFTPPEPAPPTPRRAPVGPEPTPKHFPAARSETVSAIRHRAARAGFAVRKAKDHDGYMLTTADGEVVLGSAFDAGLRTSSRSLMRG